MPDLEIGFETKVTVWDRNVGVCWMPAWESVRRHAACTVPTGAVAALPGGNAVVCVPKRHKKKEESEERWIGRREGKGIVESVQVVVVCVCAAGVAGVAVWQAGSNAVQPACCSSVSAACV